MSAVYESEGATVANNALRGILVDPWRRDCRFVQVPTVVRDCGCGDADRRALAELLGRAQKAFVVLAGDVLITDLGSVAPSWRWGVMKCSGFGLVLGGAWQHAFDDARSSVSDVRECVTWTARRRATAAAA